MSALDIVLEVVLVKSIQNPRRGGGNAVVRRNGSEVYIDLGDNDRRGTDQAECGGHSEFGTRVPTASKSHVPLFLYHHHVGQNILKN